MRTDSKGQKRSMEKTSRPSPRGKTTITEKEKEEIISLIRCGLSLSDIARNIAVPVTKVIEVVDIVRHTHQGTSPSSPSPGVPLSQTPPSSPSPGVPRGMSVATPPELATTEAPLLSAMSSTTTKNADIPIKMTSERTSRVDVVPGFPRYRHGRRRTTELRAAEQIWKDLRPSEPEPSDDNLSPRLVDLGDGDIVSRLVDIGITWQEWELAPSAVRKSLTQVLRLLSVIDEAVLECLQLDDLGEQPDRVTKAKHPETPRPVEDATRVRARVLLEDVARRLSSEVENKSSFLKGRPRRAAVERLGPEVGILADDLKRLRRTLMKVSPADEKLNADAAAEKLKEWADPDVSRRLGLRTSIYRACITPRDLDRIRKLAHADVDAFAREVIRRVSSVSNDDLVRGKPRTRKRSKDPPSTQ